METAQHVAASDQDLVMKTFAKYAKGVDTSDWDLVREAFAPDATWIMHDMSEIHGHDAIIAKLDEVRQIRDHSGYRGMHTIQNVDLEFDGDVVHGTANWIYVSRTAYGDDWKIASAGAYEDTLKRIDGRWQITSRRIINWNFDQPPA